MLNSTHYDILTAHITEMLKSKDILFPNSSGAVFILLINIFKMPTIVVHIYDQDKFHAQLS